MNFFDTHCHLNFKAFNKDLDEVIIRARDAGVENIIVPGAKTDSSRRAVEIAAKYEGVSAAVGVHPHHAGEELDFDLLRRMAADKNTVAIGEIGLDRHRYKDYPEITDEAVKIQTAIFIKQLDIAREASLPVIIHCRSARNLLLETLGAYIGEYGTVGGVFHCFEGDEKYLVKVLEMGFYIGFDGNITYPGNDNLVEIMKKVPDDRLLLETDAPFLSPQSNRGTRNEPANISETGEFISLKRDCTLEKLADLTLRNAKNLFTGR